MIPIIHLKKNYNHWSILSYKPLKSIYLNLEKNIFLFITRPTYIIDNIKTGIIKYKYIIYIKKHLLYSASLKLGK